MRLIWEKDSSKKKKKISEMEMELGDLIPSAKEYGAQGHV